MDWGLITDVGPPPWPTLSLDAGSIGGCLYSDPSDIPIGHLTTSDRCSSRSVALQAFNVPTQLKL